ncbi:hypothetical protein [Leuconostoc lactis]|uniref:hypothetical protein n=1 Tax=Leuconostoc lactis TaxID=1246 RepID=UPI003B28275E
MSVVLWVLNTLILILIILVVYFIKELPKMFGEKWSQNRQARTSKELQVESYFRQQGGNDVKKLLTDWTSFLTKMDQIENLMGKDGSKYNDLMHRTLLYGSKETIEIVAAMSQFNYQSEEIRKKQDPDGKKLMIYIATVIASLKYDFTGYKVKPISLLKAKLTDIQEYRDQIDSLTKEIATEIKRVNEK